MKSIIDTNVIVAAANAAAAGVPNDCALACLQQLFQLCGAGGVIVIDDDGEMILEYINNLPETAIANFGMTISRHIFDYQYNPSKFERVKLTPTDDTTRTYEQFPADPGLARFDPSDRKFIATSCAHPENPPILQATDLKWHQFDPIFKRHGVTVIFLCGTPTPGQVQPGAPKNRRKKRV